MAGAFVEEAGVGTAHGSDEQIEFAIAVDVGEDRAGGSLIWAGDAGLVGDVLEFPIAEVFEEDVFAVEIAEINIAEAVAIEIAEGNAGAVEEVGVGHDAFVGKGVGEEDAGG